MAVAELEQAAFADVMASHCAGVAVATCSRGAGEGRVPLGLAVTSLTSYTAQPPSVLLSVDVSSRSHDALLASEALGVHLLAHDQAAVANTFSSKADDKFAALDWTWDGEVPRLGGVLAYLRCRGDRCIGHHDHTIVVATVEAAWIEREERPLVYHDRHLEWRLVERGAAA